jgi:hypothetical protein
MSIAGVAGITMLMMLISPLVGAHGLVGMAVMLAVALMVMLDLGAWTPRSTLCACDNNSYNAGRIQWLRLELRRDSRSDDVPALLSA